MYSLFITLHVIVCFLLVVSILMQSGKSGGFAGIFGSSGEVIFSTPSGSSFLRKLTLGLAAAFGITSLVLTVMTKRRMYESVIFEHPAAIPAPMQQAPQAPAQTPPPAPAPEQKK